MHRRGKSVHRHRQPDAHRLQHGLLAYPDRQQRRATRWLAESGEFGSFTVMADATGNLRHDDGTGRWFDIHPHRPGCRHRKCDQAVGVAETGVGDIARQPRAPALVAIQGHIGRVPAQDLAQQQSMQRVCEGQFVAIGGDTPSLNSLGFTGA